MARTTTRTGGRAATQRRLKGQAVLSVGPAEETPKGSWRWVSLESVARMESGHTPSRKVPEYWDGEIPWISVKDARKHHGGKIAKTIEAITQQGIENSSARLLPSGTVCLSRTASIGYVVQMEQPMATSQGFVNWVCSEDLMPEFLVYLLQFEAQFIESLASGTVHKTLYYPEVKAFHVCLPPLEEQRRIVEILDEAFEGLARAKENAEVNLKNARELFENYREKFLDPSIRDGWRSVQLDQLINIKHGFAFKSAFFEDKGQYAVLTPGNYYETGGFKDRGAKQRYYSGEFSEEFILKKSDLLMAMTEQAPGLLGSCMIVPEDNRFLHNQRLGLITPKTGVAWSAGYFAQAFNLKAFRKGLSDTCSGATVRHTSPKRILAESIPYCENVAQLDLAAAHLSEREEDCRVMEKSYRAKLNDLDDLRQSLLQKAFEGELT